MRMLFMLTQHLYCAMCIAMCICSSNMRMLHKIFQASVQHMQRVFVLARSACHVSVPGAISHMWTLPRHKRLSDNSKLKTRIVIARTKKYKLLYKHRIERKESEAAH